MLALNSEQFRSSRTYLKKDSSKWHRHFQRTSSCIYNVFTQHSLQTLMHFYVNKKKMFTNIPAKFSASDVLSTHNFINLQHLYANTAWDDWMVVAENCFEEINQRHWQLRESIADNCFEEFKQKHWQLRERLYEKN